MKYVPQFSPGIDISFWNTFGLSQAEIETMLLTAKNLGVEWLMVRAGKGGSETGLDILGTDTMLRPTVAAADAVGLPTFTYWRCYNLLVESPRAQAERALGAYVAGGERGPFVIDVEEFWAGATNSDPMGIDLVKHWLTEFRVALLEWGLSNVMVYTRKTWWDPNVQLAWGDLPLATAHWTREEVPVDARTWEQWAFLKRPDGPWVPSDWTSADVWQFAAFGSKYGAKIGASSEDLDCNIMSRKFLERIS